MTFEELGPRFHPFEEWVRRICEVDTKVLNERIEAQKRSQIIIPELWNLQINI